MKRNEIETLIANCEELQPSKSLRKRVCTNKSNVVLQGEPSKTKISLFKRMTLIMTPLMLMLGLFITGITLANENYQSLYIDINPSVEIVLNRFDYIVKVNYLNMDAEEEYSTLTLKGKKLEQGVEEILTNLEEKGYLEKAEMLISVVSKKTDSGKQLLDKMETKANDFVQEKGKEVKVDCNMHTKEEKEAAEEHKLSPSKYKLIEYILLLDETLVLDELKEKTVEELAELVKTLTEEEIKEVLGKPFNPKDDKPFGDIKVEDLRPGKPEKHECTEECPEDCELAEDKGPHQGTKPEDGGKPEKHECTEECPEDCELAEDKGPHQGTKPEDGGKPEKHECTEECPEDCELAEDKGPHQGTKPEETKPNEEIVITGEETTEESETI